MANANLKEELQKIDESIERHEAAIKRSEDLESLKTDPRFINVIVNGYTEAEAKRLFSMLTAVPATRRETLETTHDKLEAIRHMKEYLGTATYPGIVAREAENAPDSIAADRIYRVELLSTDTEEEE